MEADRQSIPHEAYRLQIWLILLHLVYSYYNKIISLN